MDSSQVASEEGAGRDVKRGGGRNTDASSGPASSRANCIELRAAF